MARFHRSPDAPLVRVRWYVTNLPFLDTPSIINSRDWDETPYLEYPVGEVPTYSDARRYNGKWNQPVGLNGKHICETAWFELGEQWPVTHADVRYDDEWIPECCDRAAEAAQGGLEIGGAAGDLFTASQPAEGGIEFGGAAGDIWLGPNAALGGIEIGGAAGDVLATTDATAGGVEVGGTAGDVLATTDATAGGVEVGGTAGDVFGFVTTDATAGGVEVGGTAGDVFSVDGIRVISVTQGTILSGEDIVLPDREAGDELAVWVGMVDLAPAANSGWARTVDSGSAGVSRITCYTRTSDGSDATAPFTQVLTDQAGCVAVSVRGTGATKLATTHGGSGTTLLALALSPTGAPSWHCCGFLASVLGGPSGEITPTPLLERVGQISYGAGVGVFGALVVASTVRIVSGSTGTFDATNSLSQEWRTGTYNVR